MALHMEKVVETELRRMPGNDKCVDCGMPGPQWATINYGTFICLECSGKHRGLGVHISFVRSVSMDSWKDREVKAMRLGGNGRLIAHFKRYDVDKLSIIAKYNSPAAEMYRDMMLAAREGRDGPTDIAPYIAAAAQAPAPAEAPPQRSQSRSGGESGGRAPPSDAAMEAALREKAEASERLRSKFGSGGMQSMGYDPRAAGGGSAGGAQSSFEDFGAEFGAAKVAAFAGSALRGLASAAQTGARAAVDTGRDIGRKVTDPALTTQLSAGVSSVAGRVHSTVADPELLNNVQRSAGNAVSSIWGGMRGLMAGAGSLVRELTAEGPGPGGPFVPLDAPSRPPAARPPSSTSAAAAPSAPSPAADGDDDWLAAQVSAARTNLKLGGGAEEGEGEGWGVEWKEEGATKVDAPAPAKPQAVDDADGFFDTYGIK